MMNEQILKPTRPLEPRPCAIVVGASSGIGAALVRQLAQRGYQVTALARRETALQALSESCNATTPGFVQPVVHDVLETAAVPDLFHEIVTEMGGLDLIIYAAGVQPAVASDEFNFAKDEQMLRTNLLGAVAWLNQAADRFQRARRGKIVGIGSIAGDRGRVGAPVYNSSKAGLSTYLEALRNRLSRFGVNVTTIKPGFVDTVLLQNAGKTFWVISPEEAAAAILDASDHKKQTVYIPARWGLVGLIIRHIPSFIFRRLSF